MTMIDDAHHLELAKTLFNHVWQLLELDERTPEQDAEMINAAHASAYHWSTVGTPLNVARGEWQISRVYAVVGRGIPATDHASRCLELCEAHELGAFDTAFAHEAVARAALVCGDLAEAEGHIARARHLASGVEGADDRKWLEHELDSLDGMVSDMRPSEA